MSRPAYITREQMERITERILEDYGFRPDDKSVRPVPIEEIVEFHFDLQLCWEPIDQLAADGIVMAAIVPGERRIILNETQRELFIRKIGTYHFTLAHELGHWVLHAGEPLYRRSGGTFVVERGRKEAPVYYCRSSSHKPAEEVQADLFAGCLLMPQAMMVRAVKQLGMNGTIRLHHLYGLADCLKVSVSALSVRLAQLRLLHINDAGEVRRPGAGRPACEQMTLEL
ncbi:ImmA/IrrE family metallo-endopeptidase [Paenibacillus ginsengarvi]|uniref:ImmA/IrrE family metallo-endopeptidase n=1 Tax=Paenibacillus ginsengarvi TaxID=400777 RepID=A0A3B0BRT9_9BACL|nr:ImmA/IrrE family metallo-endopeptidase [Paenibacillus ginsengarvi]RKN76003.1 ImmA/IrrE family metallo-endopeptidase [Paenibacillus ginsengarvi]